MRASVPSSDGDMQSHLWVAAELVPNTEVANNAFFLSPVDLEIALFTVYLMFYLELAIKVI